MKVKVAPHAGYCYGVERALKLASKAAESFQGPIYTLGPIIHNPQVVKDFEKKGVVAVKDLSEVKKGTIIVRTHGVEPLVVKEAQERGLNVVDATCPFVAKVQQRAAQLEKEGYKVIIVGERNHPEVIGILAYAKGNAVVVEELSDLKSHFAAGKKLGRVGVVVQTTQSLKKFQEIVSYLSAHSTEIRAFNTICSATAHRQNAAAELADETELMIVVGGKNSANTTRLAQICLERGTKTFHIETAAEIRPDWFEGVSLVGITAGASTPDRLLEEVTEEVKAKVKVKS